jgi:hypothetical protein
MSCPAWQWAGARATGTSHIRANKGCDDNGSCVVVHNRNAETLILVVSDGAGSADYSALGSRIVTRRFSSCAANYLKAGGAIETISEAIVSEWLDDIRDHIGVEAMRIGVSPRSLAATLVAGLAAEDRAILIHVGDGAAVFRLQGSADWKVGSWPASGEYASTTFFVTDDPQPRLAITHLQGSIADIAVFTDGIERLVLDFATESAFYPFFEKVFAQFHQGKRRRDRSLSKNLRLMLESSAVCERTDDDKTIILGKRG